MKISKSLPNYNHYETEIKWQKVWLENKAFDFDPDAGGEKCYVLEMFFYPSGRIHMGHLRNFSIGDAIARRKRMRGYNVLHPMGADAFGLPAENAAMKHGLHPKQWTYDNIKEMMGELRRIGFSYDSKKTFATCDIDYYRHQQEIFLKMWRNGLVYRKEAVVNWDPVDKTILANEQVIDGCGWRSGARIEKKKLSQWFFKISDYSEELLSDLQNLPEWPEKVKLMQKNWIGKSHGVMIDFKISGCDDLVTVYTTRPDTLFGMACLCISPDHPIANALAEENELVREFIEKCKSMSTSEAAIEIAEKEGIDTNLKVGHPFIKNKEFPVYIANFVLMEYGTGAVFACPAHDQRDFYFAKKYDLSINTVVVPSSESDFKVESESYSEEGYCINSEFLNGLSTKDAKDKSIAKLIELGIGKRKTNYRLRDWGISRQRYWGCPIPAVHCESCGIVPVKFEELPIALPDDVNIDGKGNPLDNHSSWKNCQCPVCGIDAIRETDTMDTFVDSSWYFMRFIDLSDNKPINKELCDKILPLDYYIGGIEHAILHLIYARFFTKALRDCKYVSLDEPIKRLFNQGMVLHKTYKNFIGDWVLPSDVEEYEKNKYKHKITGEEIISGRTEKMSKSKKNIVEPNGIIDIYGADAARMFVLSDTPADKDIEWTNEGIEGCARYLNKIWKYSIIISEMTKQFAITINEAIDIDKLSQKAKHLNKETNKTIAEVSNELDHLRFNNAIAKIRTLSNELGNTEPDNNEDAKVILFCFQSIIKLLSPITPHICNEAYEKIGYNKILENEIWPTADKTTIEDELIKIAIQVNGTLKGIIEVAPNTKQEIIEQESKKIQKVQSTINNRTIIKTIYITNRLINLITNK